MNVRSLTVLTILTAIPVALMEKRADFALPLSVTKAGLILIPWDAEANTALALPEVRVTGLIAITVRSAALALALATATATTAA